jgi:hypothetical protein
MEELLPRSKDQSESSRPDHTEGTIANHTVHVRLEFEAPELQEQRRPSRSFGVRDGNSMFMYLYL